MNFYVLLSCFMVVLLIMHKKYSSRRGIFISFILFFLSAFRGEKVGHDTKAYIDISYIKQSAELSITSLHDFSDIDNSIELISNFINKIVYTLNLNGQWVVILYALIMILFVYKSSRRMNINTTYTMAFFVLLGYYFYSLSACRQICAVSVILYAMTYLQSDKDKNYYFFFWLLIAIMIHSTSFICIPLYLITILPKSVSYKKLGYLTFVISLFFTLVRIDFLNQLSILASSEHFSNYLEGYGQGSSISLSSLVGCWVETTCMIYFFLSKKKMDINKNLTAFDYIFLISIFVNAALLQYDGLVARVKYNIVIMQCLYLAQIFEQNNIKKLNFNMVLTIFILLRIVKNYFFEVALESDYYFCF